MNFKAIIENEKFKMTSLMDWISATIDIGTLRIRQNGIHLSSIDPTHVAMLKVYIAAEDFLEYELELPSDSLELPLRVNFIDLSRDFKHFGKNTDHTEIQFDPMRNKLWFKSRGINFDHVIVTEEEDEEPSLPNINFDVKLTVKTEEIRDFLKFAEKKGDYITITTSEHDATLTLETSGDNGDANKIIRLNWGEFLSKGDQFSIYSLQFLPGMFKVGMENVEIEFSSEMPIYIRYRLTDNSYILYYLAPRVEEEEDEVEIEEIDEDFEAEFDGQLTKDEEKTIEEFYENILEEGNTDDLLEAFDKLSAEVEELTNEDE